MSIHSPCRIVSAAKPWLALSLLMDDRDEGTPLVCRDKSEPESAFFVESAPGHGYTIRSCVSKLHVGANPDNLQEFNYPFVTSNAFIWDIEQCAGGEVFKILVPNKDGCVQLPDNPEDGSRVAIKGAQGSTTELWLLEPCDSN